MAKKLVIAGEIFSANLGDGIIYDSLQYLFLREHPGLEVYPLDISGRSGYAPSLRYSTWRAHSIELAKSSLNPVYSFANQLRLRLFFQRRLKQRWQTLLARADGLVIGGGKLLMDNSLDFPVKLFLLSELAEQMGVPVFLSACGVGGHWSKKGRALIHQVLSQAVSITVRDFSSLQNLAALDPGIQAQVTADPAIWAVDVYRSLFPALPEWNRSTEQRRQAFPQGTIGIGVLNRFDGNTYLPANKRFSSREWQDLWLAIINEAGKIGLKCELFTNGNLSDHNLLTELFTKIRGSPGKGLLSKINASIGHLPACAAAPRPERPVELVTNLCHYAGVIACRLHANMVAAAFGVPVVGLAWDEKVSALYSELGRAEFAIQLRDFQPGELIEKMIAAQQQKPDTSALQESKENARRSVQIVLEQII